MVSNILSDSAAAWIPNLMHVYEDVCAQRIEGTNLKTRRQCLLGLCGYCRKFIPKYANIATTLTNITREFNFQVNFAFKKIKPGQSQMFKTN